MKRTKFKVLRKDHRLMMKVREIEKEIGEVCRELEDEIGLFVGWSAAKELAAGANINDLIEDWV